MPEAPTTDLARSLATIHQICISHLDELHKLSQTKVGHSKQIIY